MSILLFVLAAVSVVTGIGMVGFGIPVKEFSFGNTLIQAGVTAIAGGLIVLAIASVAAQLQRVAEMLGARTLPRNVRPLEAFEQPAENTAFGHEARRIPFPPKPKTRAARDTRPSVEPQPAAAPSGLADPHPPEAEQQAAPMLRNPEQPEFAEADEVPLSPRQSPMPPMPPMPLTPPLAPRRAALDPSDPVRVSPIPAPPAPRVPLPDSQPRPASDSSWRALPTPPPMRPPQPAYFDAMWPSEPGDRKSANGPDEPAKPNRAETIPRRNPPPASAEPDRDPAEQGPAFAAEPPESASEPRAIAILKSGVVDGMGYTLYVDGSIEAELPQGTLRFASITELRSHLEKNSA